MTKKDLKQSFQFARAQVKGLPRKKKKFYTKALDKMYKDLIKNNLHLKLKMLYPLIPLTT